MSLSTGQADEPADDPTAEPPGARPGAALPSSSAASSEAARPALTGEQLAAVVERARARFAGVRFTATAREELDGVAGSARTLDLVFALLWRQLDAMVQAAPGREEFVGDEVSLMTRWSLSRSNTETLLAVAVCALPGLVESVEDGSLSHEHARRLVRELDLTPDLDQAQRQAITLISLYRHTGADPVGFGRKVRQLIATIDPAASANRRQAATARRQVRHYPAGDGQSVLSLTGPTERIAAAMAIIRAQAAHTLSSTDSSTDNGTDDTLDQRMFDAAMELLTSTDGHPIPVEVHLDLVVPYSLTTGGAYELAELVGYGPILPGTARDLLDHTTLVRRIAVDHHGHVINVSTPTPGPATPPKPKKSGRTGRKDQRNTDTAEREQPPSGPADLSDQPSQPTEPARESGQESGQLRTSPQSGAWAAWAQGPLLDLLNQPVQHEDLSTTRYTVPRKLKRYLEARDRRCTFPSCWRPASMTDKDHAIPWPLGPTAGPNLGCLCRHHHRAKQATFTLTRLPDGTARWTTRGGHEFDRQPEAF